MNLVARMKLTEAILKIHPEENCSNSARLELRSQVLTCSNFMYSRLVMTWPMTLAVLPRAGAVSKPHDYMQKVQKTKGLLIKGALTGNSLKTSNQKSYKIQTSYGYQNKRTTRPWRQKLNMNHVARKKLTEAKLKKASRIKLFELCKTRTKKSSLDLFNFLFTRLVMAWPKTLAGRPRAGAVSKPHDYKQNVQKMKNLLEKWASTGNCLKFSKQKTRKSSHRMENKTNQPQDTEGKNWTWTLLPGRN